MPVPTLPKLTSFVPLPAPQSPVDVDPSIVMLLVASRLNRPMAVCQVASVMELTSKLELLYIRQVFAEVRAPRRGPGLPKAMKSWLSAAVAVLFAAPNSVQVVGHVMVVLLKR